MKKINSFANNHFFTFNFSLEAQKMSVRVPVLVFSDGLLEDIVAVNTAVIISIWYSFKGTLLFNLNQLMQEHFNEII